MAADHREEQQIVAIGRNRHRMTVSRIEKVGSGTYGYIKGREGYRRVRRDGRVWVLAGRSPEPVTPIVTTREPHLLVPVLVPAEDGRPPVTVDDFNAALELGRLTLDDAAGLVGVSRSAILHWTRGQRLPRREYWPHIRALVDLAYTTARQRAEQPEQEQEQEEQMVVETTVAATIPMERVEMAQPAILPAAWREPERVGDLRPGDRGWCRPTAMVLDSEAGCWLKPDEVVRDDIDRMAHPVEWLYLERDVDGVNVALGLVTHYRWKRSEVNNGGPDGLLPVRAFIELPEEGRERERSVDE